MNPAIEHAIVTHFDTPEQRYINRELSWLAFNMRVLEEAENPNIPLIERLRFLSISASNLDEFYMVRVAGLKDQIRYHIDAPAQDGLSPREQLKAIYKETASLLQRQQECWVNLEAELKNAHIDVISENELNDEETAWLEAHFAHNIFPVLTPIAIDPAHPFPFIPNLGMSLIFALKQGKRRKDFTALVPMPHKLPRFIALPEKHAPDSRTQRFIALESVIIRFRDMLFPGFTCYDHTLFRVIRDSDLDIDDEAEDLVRVFEKAVKERRRGRVIRAKMLSSTSQVFRDFLREHLHITSRETVEVEGMIGLTDLSELCDISAPDLKFTSYDVRFPERIAEFNGDCFAAINNKDIVVHHPYESFDVVVQFLWQAAEDPDVLSIKQTLYRTGKNSPIVKALIAAAEAGKSVTALVELKARFDEEANIRWARDMERAGVHVVYGFVSLKTHAKMSLIVRQEEAGIISYAHFGTGNYHAQTAKVYTDLSYFTCNPTLCRDAAYLFNFITGYAQTGQQKKLYSAPKQMRKQLIKLIDIESANARKGKPASIWAKMNALVDGEIIDKLYEASQAGVEIDLIVRGICCLRPGIKGFSDTIRVKSLVGRFLEHARIYCFGNGHTLPSKKAKVFMASADWMPRNFDRRVEVMVPIENPTVHAQILDQIMVANIKDERQSWVLDRNGHYTRLSTDPEAFSAHDYFMTNPSLSGRGRALKKGSAPAQIALPKAHITVPARTPRLRKMTDPIVTPINDAKSG